jgi:hypothetical protein
MSHSTYCQTNKVRYSRISWTHLQVSFETFFVCLTKLLNMATVRIFLGFVGINSEPLCVELCNVM